MDEKSEPTATQKRITEAAARQKAALKTITMLQVPTGADLMGIVARQRLLKELVLNAGLIAPEEWDAREAEAKADVLEDIVAVASGRPNEHAQLVGRIETARTIEKH